LTELGCIPISITADSVERELLFDLWNILKGEENNGVSILNVKKMLLAVQGINLKPSKDEARNTEQNSQGYSMGVFDEEGIFRITKSETNKIFIRFKPLYINRMQHLGQFKRIKNYESSCTFKP